MKIGIIGGGITGLTTALAFQKCGISCTVYEQAPKLTTVGAGIWMQPNALKVLDWLEVGNAVRSEGLQLNFPDLTYKDLRSFRQTKSDLSKDESGNNIVAIHRARLQKVLFDALPKNTVKWGKEFKKLQVHENNVTAQFNDDSQTFDLILGADGIHSKVRKEIFSDTKLRYSGQTSWRGISNFQIPEEYSRKGIEAWGPGVRFGFSPISKNETYWFAVSKAPEGQSDPEGNTQKLLLNIFKEFDPLILDLISTTDKIIRTDIHDLVRLDTWHNNTVCLLGDAAHATTPNMGQGGCQGVEDAFYFATTLSACENPEDAFRKFEEKRRKKVDYVVNNSWRFGQMAHSKWGQKLAILMMKITPETTMKKQMQKLYQVDIVN
jgi:2-polyprenyl-6-methoxyphenol hydroxylase-like FAD-dependent oxidoreductase